MAKKKPVPKPAPKPRKPRPPSKKPVQISTAGAPVQEEPSSAEVVRLELLGAGIDTALNGTIAHQRAVTKVASGWQKMKDAGRKGIMLSVTEEQYAMFANCARNDNRKLASWCVHILLQEASLYASNT
jgi:hypothetical protein